ncbi:hypothetical protein [Kitasatospora sp. NPDC048407]|uniref:hypothetical protein n=1 Tax=Kitasatospora sp. NPDC048407 TaxID=3364051 RepID=UPI0037150DC4
MKTVHARTLGLRIAALAAVGLVLTACNDDDLDTGATGQTSPTAPASSSATAGASGKAKDPAKPSTRPSGTAAGGNSATAQAKTNKLALTPAEWGTGYQTSADDDTAITAFTMDKSCVYKDSGQVKTLVAYTGRFVKAPRPDGDEVMGTSVASEFTNADAAHQDMAEQLANVLRCTNYKDGEGNEFKAVHDVDAPKVAGADEVYAEEGLAVYGTTDGGKTQDRPFSRVVARKGAVTISVLVDLAPNQQVFEGRAQVRALLQKATAKW